jgi:hypothetical protein
MKVLVTGHGYELSNFEDSSTTQNLQFIHKVDASGLVLIQDGKTNEEVLKVLMDRLHHLQRVNPCRENAIVITKLEEALMWLNKRTQDRIDREVEGTAKP